MPDNSKVTHHGSAEAAVVEDPEILSGMPVLRGTRMPVFMVAGMRRSGMSMAAILAEHPTLNAELVEFAEVYADTHPRVSPTPPAWRSRAPLATAFVARRHGPQSQGRSDE